jgi:hypothetical protein
MHRQKRSAKSYQRRGPQREPYDFVVIVCEGRKSETFYFEAIKTKYRLSNANIRVTSAPGTDPMSIVKYAEKLVEENEYDRAYCVFDRDSHSTYDQAIARIGASPRGVLRAITSWPCFELWLLLHFKYTTRPFNPVGRKSAGARLLAELRRHYPAYEKGSRTAFSDTSAKLHDAMKNALKLSEHNRRCNSANPSTLVHVLVDYLTTIKKL